MGKINRKQIRIKKKENKKEIKDSDLNTSMLGCGLILGGFHWDPPFLFIFCFEISKSIFILHIQTNKQTTWQGKQALKLTKR
jgi:hypothetical protein